MKHIAIAAATALISLTALSACSSPAPEESQEAAAPVTMHEVMLNQIDANADALWDVSNMAIGTEGGLDGSLMDDAQWTQLADLASGVEAGARTLAQMDPIVVAAPGVAISDQDIPYGHSAQQVQGFVDANPDQFRALASALELHVGQIAQAARSRDAATAGPLIDQLDSVCEDCHLQYWYPEQRELVEKFRNEGSDTAGE
ncbi:hypothetical protein GCM10009127_10620 [Alteraurantiacibacter aestuarii]|uniref:Cytochrome c n=1 Tax=Alteraurantiacibacter aestuarii TaxID=650004 RepID=A0A844ZP79_9SPHN|nr:cytochrome c [Alteraurantiacibacter aestuarii]MXO87449.1 hypothetical protein [Alteraurantiacibacter aestuarii]